MTQLILGSQSPRRKEILGYYNIPFQQVTPPFDEDSVPFDGDPSTYVKLLSAGKAESLAKSYPQNPILTADTIVWKNGKIYGKPKNLDEAFQFLTDLQGDWHSVFTGVTLYQNECQWCGFEETRILFNPMTVQQINNYHSKLNWTDKAGGYAIQMGGGLAIQKIDGCYYNVMGLPINTVRRILLEVGIDLWDYLK